MPACQMKSDVNFTGSSQPKYSKSIYMILLNEFLPKVWEIRKHADSKKINNHQAIKKNQFEKSKKYLLKVKELIHEDR